MNADMVGLLRKGGSGRMERERAGKYIRSTQYNRSLRMTHHSYHFASVQPKTVALMTSGRGNLKGHVIEAWQCDRVEVVVMASWSWQNPIKHTGQEETSEGNARGNSEGKFGGMVWLKGPNSKQDKEIVKGDLERENAIPIQRLLR
jgi:hypothetical protein